MRCIQYAWTRSTPPRAVHGAERPGHAVRSTQARSSAPDHAHALRLGASAVRSALLRAAIIPSDVAAPTPVSEAKAALKRTSAFVRPTGPATPFAVAMGARDLKEALSRTADVTTSRGPVTPFDLASAGAQRAIAKVSLATYAAVCAEVAARPDLAESIFTRDGMVDVAFRQAVDASFKVRLARDPELQRQFAETFARAKSTLG